MTETKEIKTAEKALLKEATEKAEASFQKNIRDSFKKGQGMRWKKHREEFLKIILEYNQKRKELLTKK